MDESTDTTTEEQVASALEELLNGEDTDRVDRVMDLVSGATLFANAGVLTRNDGLVLTLSDGTEFQVTVVRSR